MILNRLAISLSVKGFVIIITHSFSNTFGDKTCQFKRLDAFGWFVKFKICFLSFFLVVLMSYFEYILCCLYFSRCVKSRLSRYRHRHRVRVMKKITVSKINETKQNWYHNIIFLNILLYRKCKKNH